MMMDRENRIKFLKNIGKYLIDNAENLVPQEKPYPTKQNIIISMDVETVEPNVTFYSHYKPMETLLGIDWSKITP